MPKRTAWRAVLAVVVGLAALPALARAVDYVEFRPAGRISARTTRALRIRTSLGEVSCNVTLSGSFFSGSLEVTPGNVIGKVTRAETAGCSGGRMTPLVEERAPWGIYMENILGTLPGGMTGMRLWLAPMALLYEATGFFSCLENIRVPLLLTTTVVERATDRYRTEALTVQESGQRYELVRNLGFACPTGQAATGTFSLEAQEVRAIQRAADILTAENNNIVFTGTSTHVYRFRNDTNNPSGILRGARIFSEVLFFNQGFSKVSETCNEIILTEGTSCSVEVRYTAPGAEPRLDVLYVRDEMGIVGRTPIRAQ